MYYKVSNTFISCRVPIMWFFFTFCFHQKSTNIYEDNLFVIVIDNMHDFLHYKTFFTCCNCIPQNKIWQHFQSFQLSLKPSSEWRNLQMVLETNGNVNGLQHHLEIVSHWWRLQWQLKALQVLSNIILRNTVATHKECFI